MLAVLPESQFRSKYGLKTMKMLSRFVPEARQQVHLTSSQSEEEIDTIYYYLTTI